MQERNKHWASISLGCAVVAAIVLMISVAESIVAARETVKQATEQHELSSSSAVRLGGPATADKPAAPLPTRISRRRTAALAASVMNASNTRLLSIVEEANLTRTHELIADTVLRRLPSQCRNNLRNFAVIYKDAAQRGLGGKTTMER